MAGPTGEWLRGLRESAHRWVEREASTHATARTPAYMDLIFSFGLARVGEIDASGELHTRAQAILGGLDEAHELLLAAYSFRIDQILNGHPHTGPLPTTLLEAAEGMERLPRYLVDRLRTHSRILEPDQRIEPYRHWGAKINDLEKTLAELADLTDRVTFAERMTGLLEFAADHPRGDRYRGRIVQFALGYSHRLNREASARLLAEALPLYDRLPDSEWLDRLDRARLLEGLVRMAGSRGLVEHLDGIIDRVRRAVSAWEPTASMLGGLIRSCLQTFYQLRLPDEADQLLGLLEQRLQPQLVSEGRVFERPEELEALRLLLIMAGGWYSFGWECKAEPVLQQARSLLFQREMPSREQARLACAYADTLGQAPVEIKQARLTDLFEQLRGVRDTYTTSSHFSVSQLDVVEAVVLAAVGEADAPLIVDGERSQG